MILPYFFTVEFRQPQLFFYRTFYGFFLQSFNYAEFFFIFNTSVYVAKLILFLFLDNWLWIQNS